MIKGEIWWANLPVEPYGSEPGKRRPVLISQKLMKVSDIFLMQKCKSSGVCYTGLCILNAPPPLPFRSL
jgi:hypothetical protein